MRVMGRVLPASVSWDRPDGKAPWRLHGDEHEPDDDRRDEIPPAEGAQQGEDAEDAVSQSVLVGTLPHRSQHWHRFDPGWTAGCRAFVELWLSGALDACRFRDRRILLVGEPDSNALVISGRVACLVGIRIAAARAAAGRHRAAARAAAGRHRAAARGLARPPRCPGCSLGVRISERAARAGRLRPDPARQPGDTEAQAGQEPVAAR